MQHQGTKSREILVVDDVNAICSLLSTYLVNKGHRVEAVNTVQSACDVLAARAFELVITNLNLGNDKSEGIKVIECAKKAAPSARIIVMTGGTSKETLAELTRLGIAAFFSKPFALDKLYAVAILALNGTGAVQ